MKRWFGSLPIHRKLVVLTLAVTGGALIAVTTGLIAFDVARYRTAAFDDADALAKVIAGNSAAAIVFDDAEAARQMVASLRVRPVVARACIYRGDGSLLAGYERDAGERCPAVPRVQHGWRVQASVASVRRDDVPVGTVFVERTFSDLGGRLIATVAVSGGMMFVVGVLALGIARRLQRVISRPIVELAEAARSIEHGEQGEMPPIEAPPDETGALVRAFGDMVRRLLATNEALRAEIDERRRMQTERERLLIREREASRLKDEFLAAVSHELRTPLNAILGWTHVLTTSPPSPETLAKAIAALARNAHAQQRVIEDLLDISRITTGKLPLSLASADLRAVVESAIEVTAPAATAKQIRLEIQMAPSACLVHADYDRLRQVVWNLLSNAVKFTPRGGTVTIRVVARGQNCAVEVADTGIGIAPEFIPHVFERFRQGDGSTTRQHGGLGLGLAIVKELTELHGGSVQAASEGRDRGATFTVILPAMVPGVLTGPAADASASGAWRRTPSLAGVAVLVVDDNQDALDIATAALSGTGATVRVAASGAAALEAVLSLPPDLVLCDLAMPQMDGFEVLRRMREIDARRGRVTPVLAVSAYASDEYRRRSSEAGFRGHLTKPLDPADLVRAVASAIGVA